MKEQTKKLFHLGYCSEPKNFESLWQLGKEDEMCVKCAEEALQDEDACISCLAKVEGYRQKWVCKWCEEEVDW